MRKDFGAKPILYPMPVLILGTFGEGNVPNAMNAAWGGISEENEISVCISENHKTTANLLARGAFTVSVATADEVVAADYVGIVSGTKEPAKMEKTGWHAEPAPHVDAPLFSELPFALECRVKSYDPATCRLVGEIVNVTADERILGADGKVDITLLRPITYDSMHHVYREIGSIVGKAFEDGLRLK